MNINKKLQLCIFVNMCLLGLIVIPVIIFNDGTSSYFRFGWHEDLVLISVKINTMERYIFLNLFICIIKILEVIINEIAYPVLNFNIYSPGKQEITKFTKLELQIYGNTMFLISGCKRIMMLMISITQIDIAILSMLFSEITSIFTIRHLLNKKTFIKESQKMN